MTVASFIASQRAEHDVPHVVACRALGFSESWFYKWKDRPPTRRALRREALDAKVKEFFEASERRYGSPKIYDDLVDEGWKVAEKTVADSMARQGLNGRPKRKGRNLTRPDKAAKPIADLVKRDFSADDVDSKWCGDLTEIPTDEGKLYLATVEDLASKRLPGFSMSEHHDAEVAVAAVQMAVATRGGDVAGVIFHSDKGSYQRHLFAHRKVDGRPLSFRTQAQRLISAKAFFAWAAGSGRVSFDPAASLVLPKAERRLPESTLTAEEADALLAAPDTATPLGLRDRAMLEVLYSSAIRRSELIHLQIYDVDHARGTLFIRQGKGGRDRHVPISTSALSWVATYLDTVRPRLCGYRVNDTLFLSTTGEAICPDWLSRTVTAYIAAAVPTKRGSCHMLRHTAATLMLEGGADIRYVGEMLGHAKLETTQIYTRVSIDKLRQVHAACHPGASRSDR